MSIRAGRIGKPSWPVPQTNRLPPKGEPALEHEVWRASWSHEDPLLVPATGGQGSLLDAQLGEFMGDALFRDVCGYITVRNGAYQG